ncbi:Y-family DNA polymerase [Gordonibacter sp.]|uniref:Y-family DNA polymerase n=1 Tax=Gordonibacter sp. TaxID=1968902 RepID=UPI002FCCA3AA
MGSERVYMCIDLKTFYASVECRERGLDPFTTNLVVADPDRTDTTICLAITPAMKDLGIRNRCRVFEIPESVDFIMAKPRMRLYMKVSADVYSIYLRYLSPDDIHVYSIDECFIDATPYLGLYDKSPKELAHLLMAAVLEETGICASAGIGTNLFLAKVAMDVTAKHVPDHIGYLDEEEFKRLIWHHRPITDIWNVGPGIANRLAKYHVFDLAGVVAMDEGMLYREFGVNAEFLIDHAQGIEPCTMKQIKDYEPKGSSLVNGQVLPCEYGYDEALVVLREMVDVSVLELVEKHLVVDHISLGVGYAREKRGGREAGAAAGFSAGFAPSEACGAGGLPSKGEDSWSGDAEGLDGDVNGLDGDAEGLGGDAGTSDGEAHVPVGKGVFVGEHGARPSSGSRWGSHTGGSRKIPEKTNSFKKLMAYLEDLYRETTDPTRPIKRLNVGFAGLVGEEFATLDLFADEEADDRERRMQEAVLAVKGKFGKNALLRAASLTDKATARERNDQVGGHCG